MTNTLKKITIAAGTGTATLVAIVLGTAVGHDTSPLTILALHWTVYVPAVGLATAATFAILEISGRRHHTRR